MRTMPKKCRFRTLVEINGQDMEFCTKNNQVVVFFCMDCQYRKKWENIRSMRTLLNFLIRVHKTTRIN